MDPKAVEYIQQSSYVFADNNPVGKVDVNGEGGVYKDNDVLGKIDDAPHFTTPPPNSGIVPMDDQAKSLIGNLRDALANISDPRYDDLRLLIKQLDSSNVMYRIFAGSPIPDSGENKFAGKTQLNVEETLKQTDAKVVIDIYISSALMPNIIYEALGDELTTAGQFEDDKIGFGYNNLTMTPRVISYDLVDEYNSRLGSIKLIDLMNEYSKLQSGNGNPSIVDYEYSNESKKLIEIDKTSSTLEEKRERIIKAFASDPTLSRYNFVTPVSFNDTPTKPTGSLVEKMAFMQGYGITDGRFRVNKSWTASYSVCEILKPK